MHYGNLVPTFTHLLCYFELTVDIIHTFQRNLMVKCALLGIGELISNIAHWIHMFVNTFLRMSPIVTEKTSTSITRLPLIWNKVHLSTGHIWLVQICFSSSQNMLLFSYFSEVMVACLALSDIAYQLYLKEPDRQPLLLISSWTTACFGNWKSKSKPIRSGHSWKWINEFCSK